MRFAKQYAGKWVAAKNEKIVGSDSTLTKLMKKLKTRKDVRELHYSLVPKGFIAGFHEI
jgi:hypothetical protein